MNLKMLGVLSSSHVPGSGVVATWLSGGAWRASLVSLKQTGSYADEGTSNTLT